MLHARYLQNSLTSVNKLQYQYSGLNDTKRNLIDFRRWSILSRSFLSVTKRRFMMSFRDENSKYQYNIGTPDQRELNQTK